MVSAAARLERLPFSSIHYRLFIMGALGYGFNAINGVIFAFVLPILRTEWHITSVQVGILASAQAIGVLIGALVAGTLGDLFGRRPVMIWSLAVFTFMTMVAALAQTWDVMFWLRIIEGIGAGAESAIVTPYLLEFVPSNYRGRFAGGLASFFGIGTLAAALIGFFVVPMAPNAWRIAMIICALPIFMVVWWRRSLPESPRWLDSQERAAEAGAILDKIEREFTAKHGALPAIAATSDVPVPPRIGEGNILKNIASLWVPGLARISAMTWILWFSVSFGFWAFTNWIPSLLVASGLTITKSFAYSLGIYAINAPGYWVAAWLNDRIGRRPTIVIFLVMSGLSAMTMAVVHGETAIFATGVVLSFFVNGSYGGLYAYTPEVYPTGLRTTGMGSASAFGRIGAIISPILVGAVFPAYGFLGVFGMIAVVLAAGAGGVVLLGVPTLGKSLERITVDELGSSSEPAVPGVTKT